MTPHAPQPNPNLLSTQNIAYSAGAFFGRANVFARESAMLKLSEFPLSPIFHCLKIKDGGYNNITNTNNVSPTKNTPALQATQNTIM